MRVWISRHARPALAASIVALTAMALSLLAAASADASLQWLGGEHGVFPHSESEIIIEGNPQQLASDGSRHHFLYEADGNGNRVLQFTESGTFVQAWGWSVGDGKNEFERCGPGDPSAGIEPEYSLCLGLDKVIGKGHFGGGPGEFANDTSIAVDPKNGNVFVGSVLRGEIFGSPVISEFTEKGEFVESFGNTGTAAREDLQKMSETGLAVDGEGVVYVPDEGTKFGPRLLRFGESSVTHKYEFVSETLNGQFEKAPYIAVDDKDNIYVVEPSRFERFDAADLSKPAWTWGKEKVGEAQGFTINPRTGKVYWYNFKANVWHEVTPEGEGSGKDETFPGAVKEGSKGWVEEAAEGATFDPAASIGGSARGVLYADEIVSPSVKKTPSRMLAFAAAAKGPLSPEVSGVVPSEGLTGGGEKVVVEGEDLEGVTKVTFGGVAAVVGGKDTAGEVEVTTPAHAAGRVAVCVETSAGVSESCPEVFTYVAAGVPVVEGVVPGEGSAEGGESVVVRGKSLAGATKVTFGGVEASIGSKDVAGEVEVTTPVLPVGQVEVCVTTGVGKGCEAKAFTVVAGHAPEVSEVVPGTVSTGGGQKVTVKGEHLSGATKVTFGGAVAMKPVGAKESATELEVQTPAMTAGPVEVCVTTSGFPTEPGCKAGAVKAVSTFALTVVKHGNGTVESIAPPSPHLVCGPAEAECSESFAEGAAVTLEAREASGYEFVGWISGCTHATGNKCEVVLSKATTVVATFELKTQKTIESTSLGARNVGVHGATLMGAFNPGGSAATYQFEYGDEGPCASTTCASTTILKTGNTNQEVEVSATLPGLTAGRAYHFRLVINGIPGKGEEVFETFSESSAFTADSRQFEMVSPVEKSGGEVFPLSTLFGSCKECEPGKNALKWPRFSSLSGEAVVYEGEPFSAGGGATAENEYRSERTTSGWKTVALSPELGSSGRGRGYRAFSPDLSKGILTQNSPRLSPEALPEGLEDLYLFSGGALTPLLTHVETEEPFTSFFAGASADFSHVVFEASPALTGKTEWAPPAKPQSLEKEERNLYEVAGGELRLVNVLPGNTTAQSNAAVGSGRELNAVTEEAPDFDHAVSSDGSRIFWSSKATGQVYVRESGVSTKQIPDSGKFVTASESGDEVLLNDGHLYKLETGEMEDLTSGKSGFLGILGATSDLSRIYFVDTSVLTGEHDQIGRGATAGKNNLYFYERGVITPRFIGTLSAADGFSEQGNTGDWTPSATGRTAEASPSGRYLAFESDSAFTSNTEDCAEGAKVRCQEVFEYDAQSATATCVSCDPTTPDLKAGNGGGRVPLIQPVGNQTPEPRYVVDNGRVFFNSTLALSPRDSAVGVEEVYEFEPDGVGSCEAEAGCLWLVSPGDSTEDSSFFSTDESGANVFFTTRQAVLPEDHDDLVDLYDAREHGGFAPAPTAPAPACSGDGCLGATTFSPPLVPPSAVLNGAGNPKPAPLPPVTVEKKMVKKKCKKGQVRNRHGKCVRKPAARGSHGKRGRKASRRAGR